ncbi:MAG TPA: EAL domain-containing protein [Noviherbaspirillum sp.]|uniref:putative bifunctional diguanylate cyclase/phosphodiesterase n=1 Tax=Noviherbaspirillum sp. TaxID=1926288 RepID=UPI002F9533C3
MKKPYVADFAPAPPNVAADVSPQESLDRVARLAAALLDVPAAMVSLLDAEAEWVKSCHGLPMSPPEIDGAISFGARAFRRMRPLVINEPARHARFARHPLVDSETPVRCVVSVPLHAGGHYPAGALTLFDFRPRRFRREQLRALRDLAVLAEESLRQKMAASERFSAQDSLTGLPNRGLLMDLLRHAIARWKQQDRCALVALFNLDHFKDLNLSLGHAAGDRALAAVARRLRDGVRQSDTVARIGGDEFIVILEQAEDGEQPAQVLQRLVEGVTRPLQLRGQEVAIGCSIGYSSYPEDGDSPDTLLNAANAAMYRAKEVGRATVQRYTPDIRRRASLRLHLETGLRRALEHGELLLHFQPKASLRSGAVSGVEALVRWMHPEFGLVPPAHFIPIAEETGLVVPIGEWMLDAACRQISMWKEAGAAHVPVAVNLSARQFLRPDFVRAVQDLVRMHGVPPGCLELELTESMSMDDPEKSIETMHALRSLGVSLSIDDFGTGYSSLSYLKRFPIDKLKIDRSFVADIPHSGEGRAIVQAVIAMAHRLHLEVVAEGVETEKQASFLALNQCDEIQGFYFSRPLPADECAALLRSGQRLRLDLLASAPVPPQALRPSSADAEFPSR